MPVIAENALAFVLKHWKAIAGGLGFAILGLMLVFAKADARRWHKQADQTQAAYDQTVANYRAAADEAARLDKANVARVTAEQATITERTVHDYQAQLATSADRYERLRAQAAGYLSHPGSAQTAGLPDDRETTCRAVAGTACADIPPLLKAAQDNTDQLVALQGWVTKQGLVDFGNEVKP